MVLIQLLLPANRQTADHAHQTQTALDQTRHELSAKYAGLTAYTRSPANGVWTAPDGHTEHDEVVMVEVVTGTFDRQWWRQYAQSLAQRFSQETIHVRALSIQMPDDDE